MKLHLLASFVLSTTLGACVADDGEVTGTRPGQLTEPSVLEDAPPCDATTACPEGLECMVVDVVDGDYGPRCIVPEDACDLIDCALDECLILESYPAQVACAEGTGGEVPGGDEPDGDPGQSEGSDG